ncbi:MAG: BspA family leucine-rich repeat surface protein, partial [Coriobacteriales bacterium]|nr:BspA family leucine-rich repeat surface protein [Coriobacteriales bacterium]
MFEGCENLRELDLQVFDTAQVSDMSKMFEDCKRLRSLDLSGFDMSQVERVEDMFKGCDSLKRLVIPTSWPANLHSAIPQPTAGNGMWWSEHDGVWLNVDQIRARGPMADTLTSYEP